MATTYTFFVTESEAPASDLTPAIEKIWGVETNIAYDTGVLTYPTVINIANSGLYKFAFDWTDAAVTESAYFIRIDTGLEDVPGSVRYLHMKLENLDLTYETVKSVSTTVESTLVKVTSIETDSTSIHDMVKRLVDIEHGDWTIVEENNEITLQIKEGGSNSLLAKFDLKDALGAYTAVNPHQKLFVSAAPI